MRRYTTSNEGQQNESMLRSHIMIGTSMLDNNTKIHCPRGLHIILIFIASHRTMRNGHNISSVA